MILPIRSLGRKIVMPEEAEDDYSEEYDEVEFKSKKNVKKFRQDRKTDKELLLMATMATAQNVYNGLE